MQTHEIRRKFLEFFAKNGHRVVPSDSLIPSGDPTLLFTSAGMVQFKKHFLGEARADFRRACSAQKCLRTSDIERVGATDRHLTFFEMLGNFSFGDYFKPEAIGWGWEFLTRVVGIPPEKLIASIYKDDDEAFRIWRKIVPESRIVRLGEDSNFWTMGPTGPCGPCSEILFDRGEPFSRGHACAGPGCDCDRYLEIWNLVFTQFDRSADGKLSPLPQKNIDTGMGLERLSFIANGLSSSFEIDLFQDLIRAIETELGPQTPVRARRLISDHVRACTFLVSDGILPSNEGRGYILRRLLRRALRAGWVLGKREPFLSRLSQGVADDMSAGYPELSERIENIRSILLTEERNTLATIENGTRALEEELKRARGSAALQKPLGRVSVPGERVFYIYDTYGLDQDIQKEIASDWGGELLFSEDEYRAAQDRAAERARRGWKGSGEKDLTLYARLHKQLGNSDFKGYETLQCESTVAALLKAGAGGGLEEATELRAGDEGEVLLPQTPFYAESGGQVGDAGVLESADGKSLARVLDAQKPLEQLITHSVRVERGALRPGMSVQARVDEARRRHTMRHHTATHLLHASLRKVLGKQVTQAGSLVSPEKLRFDFTFPRALKEEELRQIESDVNAAVLADVPRERSEETLEEARRRGALAFFGDKYGAKVYIVQYPGASTEVCGGTHCRATGEIGVFKILSESSVGSGVRRIEALAGEKALEFLRGEEDLIRQVEAKLRSTLAEAPEKIERLLEKQTELERAVFQLKKQQSLPAVDDWVRSARPLKTGTARVLARAQEGLEGEALKETADLLRDKLGSGIVVLAGSVGDRAAFVVTLTPDCQKQGYHAGAIAKELAQKLGGKGGGRELFAQGGGSRPEAWDPVLESLVGTIENRPRK